jgi:hypothetical protein
MNDPQFRPAINLYDPFKAARDRFAAHRKFGFFYGSYRHERLDKNFKAERVDGTDLLKLNSLDLDFTPIHVPKNYFRQKIRHDLSSFDLIMNLVTNPDSNETILRNIEKLVKGYAGKVINHPSQVLNSRRDLVSDRLSGLPWLEVPTCILLRATTSEAVNDAIRRSNLKFPVILRVAGSHLGKCVLVNHAGEIFLEKGVSYYITSFVDYRSADGLYRKFRFWFIGDKIFLRHQIISDHWNVHGDDRGRFMKSRPTLLAEERAIMNEYTAEIPDHIYGRLVEIRRLVNLDFFGLDCSFLKDGRMLFFEANASMHFRRERSDEDYYSYGAQCVPLAEEGFNSLLRPSG